MIRHLVVCALAAASAGQAFPTAPGTARAPALARSANPLTRPASFAALGASAVRVLEHDYYAGAGKWNMCIPARCRKLNVDWGADSLTYALYFHWRLTGDRRAASIMRALTRTARQYVPADNGWSDVPEWDAVADLREYEVTGSSTALGKAVAAFSLVDSVDASAFATGACPAIDFQRKGGGVNHLKTLETDSNYIKAAILLYQATSNRNYLDKAERKYQAVRTYFLDGRYPLYTAYVFDNGRSCTQSPGQYFASVNGTMIWDGAELAAITGIGSYLAQAIATGQAVRRYLGDAAGVFADMQSENDIAEPLVEAMYLLATTFGQGFARSWLMTAASAAAADRTSRGTYGRFFDGPAPRAPVTAWQGNGGLALMTAAARLDPRGRPGNPGYWRRAVFVRRRASLPPRGGRVRIAFTGRAIVIFGPLGSKCCQPVHAQVLIDGAPLVDRVGIWQSKSGRLRLAGSVLFAWRWKRRGRHAITITPASPARIGTFFRMTGYAVVR